MSWGVGIGAFVDGFARGSNLAARREDQEYIRSERERKQQNRKAHEELTTEAQSAFDQRVEAGQLSPQDASQFLLKYEGPRRELLFRQQGDYQSAKLWRDYYTSEDAKEGTRLFGSAMLKGQMGDMRGAIDDAVEAAQIKGYLAHDFELKGLEPQTDKDGATVGYNVRLADGTGNEHVWEVNQDNLMQGLATIFNPEAAWQSQVDARKAIQKAELDLQTFGLKENIKDDLMRGRAEHESGIRMREDATKRSRDTDQETGLSASDKRQLDAIRAASTEPDPNNPLNPPTVNQMKAAKRALRQGRSDLAVYFGYGSEDMPAEPKSQKDFDALPAGSVYVDPDDGELYRKPGGDR